MREWFQCQDAQEIDGLSFHWDKDPINVGKKGTKHHWTLEEDEKSVECLLDLAGMCTWKVDNGTFKPGFTVKLEEMTEQKLLGCGIKAGSHIQIETQNFKKTISRNMTMQFKCSQMQG